MGYRSVMIWTITFWGGLIGSCFIGAFVLFDSVHRYWVTVVLIVINFFVAALLGYYNTTSRLSFINWVRVAASSGVRKLTRFIVRTESNVSVKWFTFWKVYLSISYKFLIPLIVVFITFQSVNLNVKEPCGEYPVFV